MNAMQRDLKRLVADREASGLPLANQDPHRQKLHIQPPTGWLNDPNGLCKIGGTYHVFYQYSPFDASGGVKFWGHTTSPDLLHWEDAPIMLCPDVPFDCHGVYSGSALETPGGLRLYYTGNVKHPGNFDYIREGRGHNLCLATTQDGFTLADKQLLMENKDYPAGLTCHVRDPKVWKQDGLFYMVLGARTLNDKGCVLVYESADGLQWNHLNTLTTPEPFGYMWECPDLFQLDGQWFLAVSPQGIECQNVYGCGYFPVYGDWKKDYTLGQYHSFDHGFDYYAPQSFLDGSRRLQFGWMGMPDAPYGNPTVDYGWQHCLTFPRQLAPGEGDTILQQPARELETLRSNPRPVQNNMPIERCFALEGETEDAFRLTIAGGLVLEYRNQICSLTFAEPQMASGRNRRTVRLEQPVTHLEILGDNSSLEIFLNQGQAVFSTRYYPSEDTLFLSCQGIQGTVYSLKLT